MVRHPPWLTSSSTNRATARGLELLGRRPGPSAPGLECRNRRDAPPAWGRNSEELLTLRLLRPSVDFGEAALAVTSTHFWMTWLPLLWTQRNILPQLLHEGSRISRREYLERLLTTRRSWTCVPARPRAGRAAGDRASPRGPRAEPLDTNSKRPCEFLDLGSTRRR